MWTITFRRFKRDRRGVSNIIVVVLSLVIILAIVSNIVLFNYEMNQEDWDKMREKVNITNVEYISNSSMEGTQFTIENDGPLTLHLVSLWMINSTSHERYDINVFVNSAATNNYMSFDVSNPTGNYTVKVVTERGNVAIYSGNDG